jgi:hypothetical protein
MKRKISIGTCIKATLSTVALIACSSAQAGPNWQSGFLSGITYIDDFILVAFSGGPPDNCAGSPSGFMKISAANKSMQAYVTGLWLRGDASQVPIYIYTDAPPSAGAYCTVRQVNPMS